MGWVDVAGFNLMFGFCFFGFFFYFVAVCCTVFVFPLHYLFIKEQTKKKKNNCMTQWLLSIALNKYFLGEKSVFLTVTEKTTVLNLNMQNPHK